MIHQSIQQVLINNSNVLANTVQNITQNATEDVFRQESGPRGPAYFLQENAIVPSAMRPPAGQELTPQIDGAPRGEYLLFGGPGRPNYQAMVSNQGEDWIVKIAEMIRDQFGLKPKQQTYPYHHPYPEHFDRVPFPPRYRVSNFSRFSGSEGMSTIEHVNRFLAQCGEAATEDALLVRFFPLSLSESAFSWFASLPPNSINSWADLKNQFHHYFFTGITEMAPSDLMALKQKSGESITDYI